MNINTFSNRIKSNWMLITGIFIVLLSIFTPIFTSCEGGIEGYVSVTIHGFQSFTFYFSTIFIALSIASSYIGKGSFIGLILLSLIGGFLNVGMNWINEAGWGNPCGLLPTYFLWILYFGHLLILLACFINIIKKSKYKS